MKKTLLLLLLLTTARAEDRLALLIGNANYETQPLNNPINDVRGLKKTLEALNFKVRLLENGSLGAMTAALNDFRDELEAHPGSTAFFYYSGHGQSWGGTNYLMPLHSLDKIRRGEDLLDQAIRDRDVLSALEAGGSRFRFFFLDACRSVQFPNYANKDKGGLTKGMSPLLGAGSNTMIFYAAEPGKVAQDGAGKNSPFARALMQRLAEPLSLTEMMQRVTDDVATATHEAQIPWIGGSLRTPYYFKKPSGHEAPARSNPAPAETATAPSNLSEAEQKQIWQEAEIADDKENYARALELFRRLAAVGHAEAMLRISLMYERGYGVTRDYASAKRWCEKAIAAGNRDGYWRIGYLYKHGGPGLEQNWVSAREWYEKYGDAGSLNGYGWVGYLYEEGGPGLEQNYASAKEWFEKQAAAGDSNGYGGIGGLYEKGGPGLEKDLEQACRYYRKGGYSWLEQAKRVCSR